MRTASAPVTEPEIDALAVICEDEPSADRRPFRHMPSATPGFARSRSGIMDIDPHRMVLGGALLPHAPQFFTRPDTEDRETIARVERVARAIGEQLAALRPDVWLTVSNDHAQQFFLDCAPPFVFQDRKSVV